MAWHDISYLQYYWVGLYALHFRCICWSYVVWYSITCWFFLSRIGQGFPTPAFGWPHLFVAYVYYPMWEQVQVGMTVMRDLAIIKGRIKLSRSWRNDHRCWRNCSWIIFRCYETYYFCGLFVWVSRWIIELRLVIWEVVSARWLGIWVISFGVNISVGYIVCMLDVLCLAI